MRFESLYILLVKIIYCCFFLKKLISIATGGETQACKLDKETAELISLIFDQDMFKGALAKFDIDVKKMPLGKLSKLQVAKGFEVFYF
jgi:hypothetical protein